MENEVEQTTQEVVEETTNTVEETETTSEEKTFTQEEVNKLIAKEKARAKKNIPSKEELDAFNSWKESQKSTEEKEKETQSRIDTLENMNTSLEQENLILRKGVSIEDVDYVQFKVSKMDGDFEENLENYLKENSKFVEKEKKATGVQIKGTKVEEEDGVLAILKARNPNLQ